MKNLIKLLSLSFILTTGLMSCASKQGATQQQTTSVSKQNISGLWTVTDVYTEGFPFDYTIRNAFDMAPYESFKGSSWKLYGSAKGYITLTNGNSENIYWDLIDNGTKPLFQFKKVPDGEKARNIREGYQMEIDIKDKTHMVLSSPFPINNGNTAYIVYHLEKQK